jgi:hypothetical protein
MTISCNCIDEEQRMLLLQSIHSEIFHYKKMIDMAEEYKITPAPGESFYKEQIKKLEKLEGEIKGLTSCKDLWSLVKEEGKWWLSSKYGKTGPYKSESEAESYAESSGIKYIKE